MNKKHTLTALLALVMLIVACKSAQKITYHFPDTISAQQRKEMTEKCDKGKELFKIHCAECHGIFTKGQEKIPNFTDQQIDNYTARFLRHDPKNHAVTKQMSPDQMSQVLFFLRYRNLPKKS